MDRNNFGYSHVCWRIISNWVSSLSLLLRTVDFVYEPTYFQFKAANEARINASFVQKFHFFSKESVLSFQSSRYIELYVLSVGIPCISFREFVHSRYYCGPVSGCCYAGAQGHWTWKARPYVREILTSKSLDPGNLLKWCLREVLRWVSAVLTVKMTDVCYRLP